MMEAIMQHGKLTEAGMRLAMRRIANNITNSDLTVKPTGLQFCLIDCAYFIHADNRERGWWTDLKTGLDLTRNVGELLMLMVSEIAEIPPGQQAFEVMDDKLPDRLMFEVELADAAIRIFDTAGALAPDMWLGYVHGCRLIDHMEVQPLLLDNFLMPIVRYLANAMEADRKKTKWKEVEDSEATIAAFDYWLGRALHAVFFCGMRYGLHVADALIEKLEFNRNRADHKPENRRLEGGKAY